jgi:hypothetical protein
MIAEGRIHPRLRLREARELLAGFMPELAKKSPTSSPLMRRLACFSRFVLMQAVSWPPWNVSFSMLNSNVFSKLCH